MIQTLNIHGQDIKIEEHEGVWTPSPNGLFYAHQLSAAPGERVIDIGTGSGILAIWAALMGSEAVATDTDHRAIKAAGVNAALNGVGLELHEGGLFADAQGTFDAIFANLPNEIVAPAYLESLSHEDAMVFCSGPAGNEALIALLDAAPRHMSPTSRLYLPVHSITDYQGTLAHAQKRFSARLLAREELPAKEFIYEHRDFYRELVAMGTIRLIERGGLVFTEGMVYELTLK